MATIKSSSGLQPFDHNNGKIIELYYVQRPENIRVIVDANPKAVASLQNSNLIVFGIGSLFTSILAGLIPRGNGSSVLHNKQALKMLIVNGNSDRETHGMSVRDYVTIIFETCIKDVPKSSSSSSSLESWNVTDVVNCVVVPVNCSVDLDIEWLNKNGIDIVQTPDQTQPIIMGVMPQLGMVNIATNTIPKHDPSILARCILDTYATFALQTT
jgi:2-phospho-L-lactate transferase/gluconeogenesis factor (CofD/UPF0052 family)